MLRLMEGMSAGMVMKMVVSMRGGMGTGMVLMVGLNSLFHELFLFGFADPLVVLGDGGGGEEPGAANLEYLYDSCHDIKYILYKNNNSLLNICK